MTELKTSQNVLKNRVDYTGDRAEEKWCTKASRKPCLLYTSPRLQQRHLSGLSADTFDAVLEVILVLLTGGEVMAGIVTGDG